MDCKAVIFKRLRNLTLLLLLVGASISNRAVAEDLRPARIKAALVFYILKFVDWPSSENHKNLILCKYGNDEVSQLVKEVLESKPVKGRSVNVKEVSATSVASVDECHVIYFSRDINAEIRKSIINSTTRRNSLLTICEGKKEYSPYCMVQIFEDDNKARISIDKSRPTAAALSISSELLELAVIATPESGDN